VDLGVCEPQMDEPFLTVWVRLPAESASFEAPKAAPLKRHICLTGFPQTGGALLPPAGRPEYPAAAGPAISPAAVGEIVQRRQPPRGFAAGDNAVD